MLQILEEYSKLTDGVEAALDKADRLATEDATRMSHEEVFKNLRRKINAKSKVQIKISATFL